MVVRKSGEQDRETSRKAGNQSPRRWTLVGIYVWLPGVGGVLCMRKLGLALVAVFGVFFFASSAAADDRWYGFCQITDHSTLSVFSAIYYAVPELSDEFEPAYLDRTERRNTFSGQAHSYCLNYQTRAQAEAELAKMVAGQNGRVVHDPLDPSTLPKLTGPTLGNAKAFLSETLLNGVSRVHPIRRADVMDTNGLAVVSVGGGRCDSTFIYAGDWLGRPANFTLKVDWTKALDVSPFFSDPSRPHIKVLAATVEIITDTPRALLGFVIDPGSKSMEARLTKALQVIVDGCRPKSSTGF